MAAAQDVAGLHLVDVSVRPCAYVKDVINGSWKNLTDGVVKAGGKKIHGFKVIGENRLIAILDGGTESAVDALNSAYGDQIEITCTPLRTYENFAEHVLGVDKSLTKCISPRRLGTDGRLFWLHFIVNYSGLAAADRSTALANMLAVWGREATTALTLRSRGDMDMDVFKVVAQREVHAFIKVPDAEIMDDISFTLPLMKELGDDVQVITKSIMHIDQTTA